MRVWTLGDDGSEPELAVVACLHGDEVCGERAIDRVLADHPPVERPVKFVLAHETAFERGVRYVDEDLNRAFPGDPNGDTVESRLAASVLDEVADCTVLDLHSTVSHPDPFAVTVSLDERSRELAGATGLDRVVDGSYVAGGLVAHVDGVAVECGIRGSDEAADNAERVVRNFLAATGAFEDEGERTTPTCFRILDAVEGRGYRFCAENFERVEAGEAFAERETDGDVLRADEPFYPVLMSTGGYQDILGFRAERVE